VALDLFAPNKDITVRPAVAADVFALASNLRQDDEQEVADMSGKDPVEAIGQGFVESSKCFTICWKGAVAGMMGVVPSEQNDNPRLGIVWMLGSEQLALFGFSLVKYARAWLRELIDGYDVVGNLVSVRNPAHVRFIQHLGGRIVKRYDACGPGQVPACEFVFDSEDLKETPRV
jgi:hypothetical protein